MTQLIANYVLDHIPLWAYLVGGALLVGALLYFFSPVLIPIWNMLPKPIKVVLMGIVAVLGAYLGGRYKGSQDEREAERKRDAEAQNKRNEVDNEVDRKSADEVSKDLDPWYRD